MLEDSKLEYIVIARCFYFWCLSPSYQISDSILVASETTCWNSIGTLTVVFVLYEIWWMSRPIPTCTIVPGVQNYSSPAF